jgi:Tfp pilus assembly protein PilN
MIEINLLPAGIRTHEGTPPARFAAYMGCLVVLLTLGYYIGKVIKLDIPNIETQIGVHKTDKKTLTDQKTEVEALSAQIDDLNHKIADLDDLNLSRVRFARLFDRLTTAVPEGVWFRTFTVGPDASISRRYPPAGRRYSIVMSGNAIGPTPADRNHKITELLSNLEKQFNIPPDTLQPPTPVPEDFGFCKFVGARFERPRLTGTTQPTTSLVTLVNVEGKPDPKLVALVNPPKEGADFTVQIIFDMPAPKNTGN